MATAAPTQPDCGGVSVRRHIIKLRTNAAAVAYDVNSAGAWQRPVGYRPRLLPQEPGKRGAGDSGGTSGLPSSSNPSREVSCNGAPVILVSYGRGSRGLQSSAAPLCRVEGVVEVASRPPALIVPAETLRLAADSYPIRSRATTQSCSTLALAEGRTPGRRELSPPRPPPPAGAAIIWWR